MVAVIAVSKSPRDIQEWIIDDLVKLLEPYFEQVYSEGYDDGYGDGFESEQAYDDGSKP
jgi:hypothetical protein